MCAAQTAANCCLGCPTDNVPAPGSAGEAGPGDCMATWLAVSCVAYSHQLLPRTRAVADPGTSSPCPAAFPVRPTSGCLAYSGACGHGHHAPTRSDANRFAPREAVGPEGHVGRPPEWLTYTSAAGVPASDRRRLDLVVYGASLQGLALCCDATLARSEGVPHPRAERTAGVALLTAERRKHATYPGGQRCASWRRGR